MINIQARNQEIQDNWDRMARDMWEELPSAQFLSYLDTDDIMHLFVSALQDRSERCLKSSLTDMALHVYGEWEKAIAKQKSGYQQFLDDHYDTDILDSDQLQDVLTCMDNGQYGEALKRLNEYRKAAFAVHQERADRESDAYIDFMVDQHGVDRFGSAQAGHEDWHKEKARRAA